MTAQECLTHEWLFDIFNPLSKLPGTSATNEVIENCDENTIGYDTTYNNNVDDTVKSDSRDRIVDQHSQMSLDEVVNDETTVNDEENAKDINESVENTDELEEKSDDSKLESVTNAVSEPENCDLELTEGIGDSVAVQTKDHANQELDTEVGKSVPVTSVSDGGVLTATEDITPDTDSSMCISEAKAQDTDSGMVTGSDTKSGRESVELDLLNEEHNVFDAQTEDSEMLSKSTTEFHGAENEEKTPTDETEGDIEGDTDSVLESDTQGTIGNISKVKNANEESEHMDLDHSDTVFESSEPNKSTNTLKTIEEHSKAIENENESVNNQCMSVSVSDENTPALNNRDQNLNNSSHSDILMQSFGEGHGVSTSTPIKHSLVSGGRSSVGNIDDSINSMQLGERLKRGMCNESPGNAENIEDEEYEFISVSKRVRSIEDSMDTSRSPPFSPKIARSPRVARHSRHNHQHH